MRLLIFLASFLVGFVVFVVGAYFAVSLVVAYLKLTGAVEGQPMFFDFRTPGWGGLLLFQAACVAIIALGFVLRARLRAFAERRRGPPAASRGGG